MKPSKVELRLKSAIAVARRLCAALAAAVVAYGHDGAGHHPETYEVTPAAALAPDQPRLTLTFLDAATGEPTPARFSLEIDGESHVPDGLGAHGLRFVSIHAQRLNSPKGGRREFTYGRGTGPVEVPLGEDAKQGVVSVAKGLEYLPTRVPFVVAGRRAAVTIRLARWCDLSADGWRAAEEHVHYDRTDPRYDVDWLGMVAADGLTHAHFLMLKGGATTWANQNAYGPAGEGTDGHVLIRPGEEYRDGLQGHINLLGIREIIQPVSTGRIGPPPRYNYPPLVDVLRRTRELGGVGGSAHGGRGLMLGGGVRSSTFILDTVLGAVDFVEIANLDIYRTDQWYLLLNAGYMLPPTAGTDLPNYPAREWWQPFLGGIRTYVRVGDRIDFETWAAQLKAGASFITSGPLIGLEANGAGPGGVVHLPEGGGEVEVRARLECPRSLVSLEIVQSGTPLQAEPRKTEVRGIHRWDIIHRLRVTESGWLAARGTGGRIPIFEEVSATKVDEIAHTSAIRILVGGRPIGSAASIRPLMEHLRRQREHYRTEAKFERDEHRARMLGLFDEALARLTRRSDL